MKKLGLSVLMMAALGLAACGADEENEQAEQPEEVEAPVAVVESPEATEPTEKTELEEMMAKLEEPTEDTKCEVCDMDVYMKDHEMGMFSAQAIKADGSNAFYDDIGCLLNAELINEEENTKFVRDFDTKEWVKVDDATIVKTDLKSPMNWGYISYVELADAKAYVAKHEGAAITELAVIQSEAKERYEQKQMKMSSESSHDMHSEHDH
ncbi:nitrous oxide reductase accessory protein NosL [Sporosarcina sp. GW1-11]|uniref:nitrous oxide reductase accessory protein NosL n=1 Tax=Sporosarcina sp. GW1-11 TaxID=2899126 RepID=UPI00294CEF33|nr:nitrous oxide reductase accessory protein NosL [Sporosarcina sp. GW1-11]MDV6377434.1 nitrous oxide reductase accessory protein NosL [Sporosarcina sp. GW1-11]